MTSRRRFLEVVSLFGAGSLLAACAPAPTSPPAAAPTSPPAAAPTSPPAAPKPTEAPKPAPAATTAPAPTTAPATAAPAATVAPAVTKNPKADRLVVGESTTSKVDDFDLAQAFDTNQWLISQMVAETLVLFDYNTLSLKPRLAESWTVAPDGKSVTFKLRKGVKW